MSYTHECTQPDCDGTFTKADAYATANAYDYWFVECPKCHTKHRCGQFSDGQPFVAALEPHEYMDDAEFSEFVDRTI